MQQSDFEKLTEGTNENGAQALDTTPGVVSKISDALNQSDHETAGILLGDALEKQPGHPQLLRLAARQRRLSERFFRVYSLLKETNEAIEADEFVRAVGAYREAANLSLGFSALEQATFDLGMEEAADLGDRNWRIARALLEDAGRLNQKLVVPEQKWHAVRAAERAETIANVLEETALAKPSELAGARERLMRALEQYPEDAGLANRLKSIESTIEEKRKWDQRQKCLKKLTDLRAAMQRETDPAQAGKYVPQAEALAAPYIAELEFVTIVEDVRHQVLSCARAVTALQQDRLQDCLVECAWVLSRMRHHQLFLNLMKQVKEREFSLADEYSDSVARIKELLAAGKLAEAEAICNEASAQLSQFADFEELKSEIATRRAKEDRYAQESSDDVRRLLERAERSLREQQYRLAEQAFAGALKLRPGNQKLPGHIGGLLQGYARSIVRENPRSAEEVLQLMTRLLPHSVVPADLAEAVRQEREHAKEEAVRWASLDKIATLDSQLESAKKREQIKGVRDELAKHPFTASASADVRDAATSLSQKIEGRTRAIEAQHAPACRLSGSRVDRHGSYRRWTLHLDERQWLTYIRSSKSQTCGNCRSGSVSQTRSDGHRGQAHA